MKKNETILKVVKKDACLENVYVAEFYLDLKEKIFA